MQYGYSLPERLNYFQELLSNPSLNSKGVYKGYTGTKFEDIDIYEIPIELPKYRIANTRTLHLQDQYIFENHLEEDFFNDVESDQIQEIQHHLLKKLIHNSDKRKDLPTYFSKTEQTDPLILTNDGFVISGNRRLCTYRELLENNYEKNKQYVNVRVAILPKLGPQQVEQIEDFLEQQTDIKEPFAWISRAIGYRNRMHTYKISDSDLAKITGKKKNEISRLVNMLEIADRYLESLNRPKDYDQILSDELAFEKIFTGQLKTKDSAIQKMAFEKLSFLAIKNKGNGISDRMYKNIPIIHEAQPLIFQEINNEFEEELKEITDQHSSAENILGLGFIMDPVAAILKLISDSNYEERIVDIVSDKIEEVISIKKEKKKKSGVFERVSKANTLLLEANILKSQEDDKGGVLNQLQSIEREIQKLRQWVDQK